MQNSTKMGKITTFEKTNIGYSSLQIKNFDILDSLIYQYQKCFNNNCQTLNDKIAANSSNYTLLIMDAEYILDKNTLYYRSAKTDRLFPNHFFSLQYNDSAMNLKTVKIENITPSNYNGIILQVPNEIKFATKINLLVTIRDKRYGISLK